MVDVRLVIRNACVTPIVLVRAALMLAGRALMMVGRAGERLEDLASRLPAWRRWCDADCRDAWQRVEERGHARQNRR
ncbi:MAG: hypothetical protein N2690_00295 [Rhodocyclaceae bacterium]|nr:hypothetical protein [Rhodocyclaceae bacterium]